MNRPYRNQNKNLRSGTVTVEFALCASIFFMLIFTMLEFARFMFVTHSVQMVAYESARTGVVPGATADHVQSRAEALLSACGVRQATVVIDPPIINSFTEDVTVSVSCDFTNNSWLPPTWLTGQTISSATTLEHENKAYLNSGQEELSDIFGNNDDEPLDE